jgi:hypothetical protein
LTKDVPRIPFYSAIYSKPEVPKSLFSKFVKSLHSVFKSDAFNPKKAQKVPQSMEHHEADHHDVIHHEDPVSKLDSKKSGKPPKVKNLKPKEDEDEEDDDDD